MKFLIAIKNISDESKNILEIGCKIAEGFSADLTICYVGKKSKALIFEKLLSKGIKTNISIFDFLNNFIFFSFLINN